ncbi:tail fiber assembly protein [Mixta mediterraneensis]|uniref:tail fiber assembly protein n=1 Tax=Mixta mediterraneensis TaxID=2758443 RepID=UPI003B000DBB
MPRHEALIHSADSKKKHLSAEAEKIMAPLRDAIELEIATEQEKMRYVTRQRYRVPLSRIDTSLPENIIWPPFPEE